MATHTMKLFKVECLKLNVFRNENAPLRGTNGVVGLSFNQLLRSSVILLFACICFSACKTQQKTTNNSVVITDKEWVVVQLGEHTVEMSEERTPTLTMSDGKASGHGSCNRYHGSYSLAGDKISFSSPLQTKMYCPDTQQTEEQYMEALSNVKSWKYSDEKLYFLGENKEVLVVFKGK